MKRILSLIASLGLVFGANGHSIDQYLRVATPGGELNTSDETLMSMLSDDSGLNNVAIVEAVLLAKGGFEYQEALGMSFADKQAKLQESLGAGSPLPPSTDLVVFGDGAGAGDSFGVYPAPMPVFVEPATGSVSSLPEGWGTVVTDANNLAQVEAFLFNLFKDYEKLSNENFDSKLAQYLSAVGASPAPVELVEEVLVPAAPAPAPELVEEVVVEPVIVPVATGGANAETIIAYLGDRLSDEQRANLRTYSDLDLKVIIDTMISARKKDWVIKAAIEGAGLLSPKPAPVVRPALPTPAVSTPAPVAVSTPAPVVVSTPAPAVGARPNMSLALAQIVGGGQALKPADGVFIEGDKAASEAVQAQLKDFVEKTGKLQALLTNRSVDEFTPDIKSKLNYYIAVADYIKSARNQSGFELADEAVDAWISNTYLTLKSLVEKDKLNYAAAVRFGLTNIDLPEVAQSGKLIVEEQEDFDPDEEEDEVVVIENRLPNWMAIPFKAEYDRQKATPPAVSSGGMGAPTPRPAAASRPPILPPPPKTPAPASIVAITPPPAPAASAASSGSVSTGLADDQIILIGNGLIQEYNLSGADKEAFNGFVTQWLSTSTDRGPSSQPSFVFDYKKLNNTTNIQKAKARFLIDINQTTGVDPVTLSQWRNLLGLA